MKKMFAAFALAFAVPAFAQSVDVKGLDTTGEGTTTIKIEKNKKEETTAKTEGPKWEITEGNAEVEGEPAATAKEARATWKTACDSWKKEIREDNKENKVMAINCGTASCGGDAGSKTCVSKASYKIKTRVDQ